MKKILIYDTETTGLFPAHKDYSRLSDMPRLIQLGYAAYEYHDGVFIQKGEKGQLVCPVQDFEIGESAFNAHGISKEQVIAGGVPPQIALEKFLRGVAWADLLVCHKVLV